MWKTRTLALLLATFAAATSGCGGETRASRQAPSPPGDRAYRVGIEDVLAIVVWKEPELSTTVPVRPDGRITVPLAGEIPALGRTTREIEADVAARLAATIASPMVTVVVKELHAGRVYVLGEVARPGMYPMRGRLTVLQALALAGGLTEFADRDDIVVLRPATGGGVRRLRFDYGEAVDGGDALDLEPGDTVVVK